MNKPNYISRAVLSDSEIDKEEMCRVVSSAVRGDSVVLKREEKRENDEIYDVIEHFVFDGNMFVLTELQYERRI